MVLRFVSTVSLTKNHSHISRFSTEDDIDLFPDNCLYPVNLPKLMISEELLNVKCHKIMSMYRINSGGTWKYNGQVLNLQQEN